MCIYTFVYAYICMALLCGLAWLPADARHPLAFCCRPNRLDSPKRLAQID